MAEARGRAEPPRGRKQRKTIGIAMPAPARTVVGVAIPLNPLSVADGKIIRTARGVTRAAGTGAARTAADGTLLRLAPVALTMVVVRALPWN